MKTLNKAALSVASSLIATFALEQYKASKGNIKGEKNYLLILGCTVKGNEAEPILKMRCEKAAEYLKSHPHTVAVACGGIVHKDQTKSEAQAIKEILISKGIEEERIILEDKSTTTAENFINAKKLIPELNADNAAFLSSEFHLLRASCIAKKCGLNLETVAAPSPKNERPLCYVRELFAFPLIYSNLKKGEKENG